MYSESRIKFHKIKKFKIKLYMGISFQTPISTINHLLIIIQVKFKKIKELTNSFYFKALPILNISSKNHNRNISHENAGVYLNDKIHATNKSQSYKRTKSVNPASKIKSNLIQTPKKKTMKLPFNKANVNKSTSYNKKLETSVLNGNEGSHKIANQKTITNNLFIKGEGHNEENTIAKKYYKEPRNLSTNKNKIVQKKNDVSNEKKGKFLV